MRAPDQDRCATAASQGCRHSSGTLVGARIRPDTLLSSSAKYFRWCRRTSAKLSGGRSRPSPTGPEVELEAARAAVAIVHGTDSEEEADSFPPCWLYYCRSRHGGAAISSAPVATDADVAHAVSATAAAAAATSCADRAVVVNHYAAANEILRASRCVS